MKAEGATPAIITDHPFTPRGEWWSPCRVCGLGEAAHSATTLKRPEWLAQELGLPRADDGQAS